MLLLSMSEKMIVIIAGARAATAAASSSGSSSKSDETEPKPMPKAPPRHIQCGLDAPRAFSTLDADGVGRDPYRLRVADLDGDGNPDVVTTAGGDHHVTLLFGRAPGVGFDDPVSLSATGLPVSKAGLNFGRLWDGDLISW